MTMPGRALMVIFATAALLAAGSASAAMDKAEQRSLFAEANELFRKANSAEPAQAADFYRQAVMRYERIAEEGQVRNGRLYYNIGNAYYRLNDIGRAIFNYRKAQMYIPNDANLAQNLKAARARCQDSIGVSESRRVLEVLFFWHYDFPGHVKGVAFMVLFALAWLLAAARLFARKAYLGWVIGIIAVVATAFLASISVDAVSRARTREGVIIAPSVVARKGDGEAFDPSFKEPLHAGTEFRLRETRGEWHHARLSDGRECWIPAGDAQLIR